MTPSRYLLSGFSLPGPYTSYPVVHIVLVLGNESKLSVLWSKLLNVWQDNFSSARKKFSDSRSGRTYNSFQSFSFHSLFYLDRFSTCFCYYWNNRESIALSNANLYFQVTFALAVSSCMFLKVPIVSVIGTDNNNNNNNNKVWKIFSSRILKLNIKLPFSLN